MVLTAGFTIDECRVLVYPISEDRQCTMLLFNVHVDEDAVTEDTAPFQYHVIPVPASSTEVQVEPCVAQDCPDIFAKLKEMFPYTQRPPVDVDSDDSQGEGEGEREGYGEGESELTPDVGWACQVTKCGSLNDVGIMTGNMGEWPGKSFLRNYVATHSVYSTVPDVSYLALHFDMSGHYIVGFTSPIIPSPARLCVPIIQPHKGEGTDVDGMVGPWQHTVFSLGCDRDTAGKSVSESLDNIKRRHASGSFTQLVTPTRDTNVLPSQLPPHLQPCVGGSGLRQLRLVAIQENTSRFLTLE